MPITFLVFHLPHEPGQQSLYRLGQLFGAVGHHSNNFGKATTERAFQLENIGAERLFLFCQNG